MQLTVAGSGDAFGSGGRLQPCFHVKVADRAYLLDCGATVLTSLRRAAIEPNSIDTVVISHLHGDHYAGLIWLLLYGQHPGRRTAPLSIYGPVGIEDRVKQTSELLYPGSMKGESRFPVTYTEFDVGDEVPFYGGLIHTFAAQHPSGAPSMSIRLEHHGKKLAYSGDTSWNDQLISCAEDADLFLTECYAVKPPASFHIDWQTLSSNLDRITARKILLTHMSESMLSTPPEITDDRVSLVSDGMVITI